MRYGFGNHLAGRSGTVIRSESAELAPSASGYGEKMSHGQALVPTCPVVMWVLDVIGDRVFGVVGWEEVEGLYLFEGVVTDDGIRILTLPRPS